MPNRLLNGNIVGDDLIINLCTKIDLENAAQVEEELFELMDANPDKDVTLDAENLDYISSAGLRILLEAKESHPNLKMVNAGNEVYEILEMTGFNSIIPISKKLRELSIEGLDLIGEGFAGKVYRLDDETVVKVIENKTVTFNMIQTERYKAQKVLLMGIPSAISFDVVRVGDNYGIVYELVNSDSVMNHILQNKDQIFEMGRQFGEFMRQVHSIEIEGSDLEEAMPVLKNRVEAVRDDLTEEEYNFYMDLLDSIPEKKGFVHGDFHPGNVLYQKGEMVLIDMGDSGVGHPIIDLIALGVVCIGHHLVLSDEQLLQSTHLMKSQSVQLWQGILHGYFD